MSRTEPLTIRLALPTDAAALRRLAQLDSVAVPDRAPMLVAEIGDTLHAALPLDGGAAIADPFRRTAELVGLLQSERDAARLASASTNAARHPSARQTARRAWRRARSGAARA